jgi:enamine deaminase RidA (YjgF/YER057c/UK114 family)
MESNTFVQSSETIPKDDIASRWQILMQFIKNIIHQIKVTREDLIDAGVYLRWMDK